ncbi:alpha/beta fold hydrolase [Flavisolibacter ginsenosidimutans]|uniref:Alpha/beta hydrolase n=1 Tax=Flavisolibacter ginsenosidimutans TaxID=661481 RepID=A0A5B8UMU7_9BACT|nr:alpha/beta hydrolase [Flavisolibacter ginsenosidimutans]QEC57883.1 alpha/beta hydrolase [Flavisolibacter ginsenosidimutans]
MQTKEFNYNGKKILYRTAGKGPLVVLLHGFGEDGTIWKNQFDIFPNYQLLVPDLPGSGGSERIDDMSTEGLAEAIYALIKSLTPGEAILIGHSMGGYVTLAFAAKFPEALNAFGLFHSTAYADNEAKKDGRRKGIAAMNEQGAEAFLKTFVPNLYSPVIKEKNPALIDKHLNAVRNFSAESLVKYFEAMMQRPDRTTVLENSSVPVLFVMSEHDAAVPLEDSLKQCHLPPLSFVHLLQASGHMGMVEEAEEANKILIAFINAVETIA